MGPVILFMLKLTICSLPLLAACFFAERLATSQNQRVPAKVWSGMTSACLACVGVLAGLVVLIGGSTLYQILLS